MKSGAFNKMIAESYTTPQKTLSVYGRFLKEAGLLTMGEKGWKAPDMTPLDAARMTIALLASDGPRHCVERVKLFGAARFTPSFRRKVRGYETMSADQFRARIEGETLEDALAYLLSEPSRVGLEQSAASFAHGAPFELRVSVFDVLAELSWPNREGDETTGELVAPFKGSASLGELSDAGIKGGIRTVRSISGLQFFGVGIALAADDPGASREVS